MGSKARRMFCALVFTLQLAASLACGFADREDPPPPVAPPPPVVVAPPPIAPAPIGAPVPAPIVNHEAPGNLAATRAPLGCIGAEAIESTMNPVDLYASMEACARADRPGDALLLFALAGTFGRFDTLRVADRSGHAAHDIVMQRHRDAVPAAQWDAVGALQRSTTGDPVELARFCARIRPLGPPTYYPTYMIRHGMRIFVQNDTPPLVANFDPAAGWASALDGYLHCPPQ
jgi:hypothetical protein